MRDTNKLTKLKGQKRTHTYAYGQIYSIFKELGLIVFIHFNFRISFILSMKTNFRWKMVRYLPLDAEDGKANDDEEDKEDKEEDSALRDACLHQRGQDDEAII